MKEMVRCSSDTLRGESNNFNRVVLAAIQVLGTKKVREDVHNQKGSFKLQRWQVSSTVFRVNLPCLILLPPPAHFAQHSKFCRFGRYIEFYSVLTFDSVTLA
jgi:hypothetical protein